MTIKINKNELIEKIESEKFFYFKFDEINSIWINKEDNFYKSRLRKIYFNYTGGIDISTFQDFKPTKNLDELLKAIQILFDVEII